MPMRFDSAAQCRQRGFISMLNREKSCRDPVSSSTPSSGGRAFIDLLEMPRRARDDVLIFEAGPGGIAFECRQDLSCGTVNIGKTLGENADVAIPLLNIVGCGATRREYYTITNDESYRV